MYSTVCLRALFVLVSGPSRARRRNAFASTLCPGVRAIASTTLLIKAIGVYYKPLLPVYATWPPKGFFPRNAD